MTLEEIRNGGYCKAIKDIYMEGYVEGYMELYMKSCLEGSDQGKRKAIHDIVTNGKCTIAEVAEAIDMSRSEVADIVMTVYLKEHDPCTPAPDCGYNIKKVVDYARTKGMQVKDLTEEEIDKFRTK